MIECGNFLKSNQYTHYFFPIFLIYKNTIEVNFLIFL